MNKIKGFTLIELMVVAAVLAILSTIGIITFSNAQKNARDAQRLRDLNGIKQALEFYRSDNGSYPPVLDDPAFIPKYLQGVPSDPLGGSRIYQYQVSDGTSFILCGLAEGTDGFSEASPCNALNCNNNPVTACDMTLFSD